MKTFLVLVAMISLTVVANILLKSGAMASASAQGPFSHLVNWRVLLGLCSFGLAACLYVVILQWLPLNVAQSFAAAQFIAVVFASRLILFEPIAWDQWFGIALISAGISVVAWSQR